MQTKGIVSDHERGEPFSPTYLSHNTGMLVRGVESLSLVNLPDFESLLQLRSTIQSEFDLFTYVQ